MPMCMRTHALPDQGKRPHQCMYMYTMIVCLKAIAQCSNRALGEAKASFHQPRTFCAALAPALARACEKAWPWPDALAAEKASARQVRMQGTIIDQSMRVHSNTHC
jgi:hypothetical protein